ncbi:MAG: 50S ribosomal protein L11 methyltransferase, partial [Clostridia bacterium]
DPAMIEAMSEDVLVRAYFAADACAGERIASVRERLAQAEDVGFDMGSLALALQNVREEDWAENWKQYYKPFRAGKTLVVKPTWEPYDAQAGDCVMEIDPGMAFGTGTHETTAMCLTLVERYMRPDMTVLDVGTGSGILSIAAALLGARRVLAVDLDPTAVRVARENIEHNHLAQVVEAREGDLLAGVDIRADLVVANIIANVIILLSPAVGAHLKPGGVFLCSGIIREREQDVRDALQAAGYCPIDALYQGEWVALAAKLDA